VVVACAFGAFAIKEVSRTQLRGAAKLLLTKQLCAELRSAEKQKYIFPLAKAFIEKGIVVVEDGSNMSNLTRNNVKKIQGCQVQQSRMSEILF